AAEAHLHLDRLVEVRDHADALAQPVPDETVAIDREGTLGDPADLWVRHVERGRVVVDLTGGQHDRLHAPDREHEPVEEPSVLVEEPCDRPRANVPTAVREHEARSLEDRDGIELQVGAALRHPRPRRGRATWSWLAARAHRSRWLRPR